MIRFLVELASRSRVRLVVSASTVSVVCFAAVLAVWKASADQRYFDGYDASLPLDASTRSTELLEGYEKVVFEFQGVEGERVPGLMALPYDDGDPAPCIIFLHGIGQRKEFLDEIAGPYVAAGFAMATFDQYTRGERKFDGTIFAEAAALRRRGALTVNETRRLIDYLTTRDDIDAHRIYLLGASYGAITGSIAAAFDERIQACVFTYGGADLPKLLDGRESRAELGMFTTPLATFAAWFLAPMEPADYVGRIAPRPVMFQNGMHDGLISNASAKAFHEAAGEPKEIVWYDSDHIGLDEDHVRVALDATLDWFVEQDGANRSGELASAAR